MKGKLYTTEDKIRILRESDRGEKSVLDICRAANISEVSSTTGSISSGTWK